MSSVIFSCFLCGILLVQLVYKITEREASLLLIKHHTQHNISSNIFSHICLSLCSYIFILLLLCSSDNIISIDLSSSLFIFSSASSHLLMDPVSDFFFHFSYCILLFQTFLFHSFQIISIFLLTPFFMLHSHHTLFYIFNYKF